MVLKLISYYSTVTVLFKEPSRTYAHVVWSLPQRSCRDGERGIDHVCVREVQWGRGLGFGDGGGRVKGDQ